MKLLIEYDAHVGNIHVPAEMEPVFMSAVGNCLTGTMDDDMACSLHEKGLPVTYESGLTTFYDNSFMDTIFTYRISTGLLFRLISMLRSHAIEYSIAPYLRHDSGDELPEGLWDHQTELVTAALDHQRCCISSPTGSGKSRVIGTIIRQMDTSTIVSVPSVSLLHQTYQNLSQQLGIPIGRVGDGLYEVEKVTVAMPASLLSLIRRGGHEEYLDTLGTWIIDECHNISPTYVVISQRLRNTYTRIGVSATVWKGNRGRMINGGELLIESICGPLVKSISEAEMVEKGIILRPEVHFYHAGSVWLPPRLQGDFTNHKYNMAYNLAIVRNKRRNELAAQLIADYIRGDNGPLAVIVKRVNTTAKSRNSSTPSHAELIADILRTQHDIDLPIIHGGSGTARVQEVFSELRSGALRGCISGPGVFKEGVDIPNMGGVVLLTAGSSSIELIQRIGRVLRRFPGKGAPIFIDFIDGNNWFASQSSKRMNMLKELYGECVKIHN